MNPTPALHVEWVNSSDPKSSTLDILIYFIISYVAFIKANAIRIHFGDNHLGFDSDEQRKCVCEHV